MNATLFSIAPLKVICNGELNPVDVTVTTTYTSTLSPWLGVLDHRKQLDRPSTFGLCRTTLQITKDLTWTLSLSLAMVRNKHTNNQTKRQKKHRPSNGRANKQTILLEKEGLGLILKIMATLTGECMRSTLRLSRYAKGQLIDLCISWSEKDSISHQKRGKTKRKVKPRKNCCSFFRWFNAGDLPLGKSLMR